MSHQWSVTTLFGRRFVGVDRSSLGDECETCETQPAGWYRDTERPNLHRYWTGERWSDWVGEELAVLDRARVPEQSHATDGTTSAPAADAAAVTGPTVASEAVGLTRQRPLLARRRRVASARRSPGSRPAASDVLVLGHHLAGDRLRSGRGARDGGGLGAGVGEAGRHEADLDLGPAARRGADDGAVVGQLPHGLVEIDLWRVATSTTATYIVRTARPFLLTVASPSSATGAVRAKYSAYGRQG